MSAIQTGLFSRLVRRVSTWICSMPVSYNGEGVNMPNEKS
jgi:hypothetical protein